MKIMVSACLLGQNCKYNGGNNYCDKVASFLEGHEAAHGRRWSCPHRNHTCSSSCKPFLICRRGGIGRSMSH